MQNIERIVAGPDNHVVLFSAYSKTLATMAEALKAKNIGTFHVSGNIFQRNKAVATFKKSKQACVMLLDLTHNAAGLNLPMATHVLLLDRLREDGTARAAEQQAIGRVHRQGQRKRVTVLRFVTVNSIEEDMFHEQQVRDRKRKSQQDYYVWEKLTLN